jgi:dihydrofolate reductase
LSASPKIALILAMTRERVIGKNNQLPWKLPQDLKYFKETTMGKPIIMGRKTLDSMGRALPGRKNIVVSRNPSTIKAPAVGVPSLEAAVEMAKKEPVTEVFIIGGAQIFEEALKFADRLYITWIDAKFEGDVFFPEWDQKKFRETSRTSFHDPFPHHYCVYERKI